MRISLAVAIFCLLMAGARMRGQEKADMTVHVKVVNVPATVRDKHGKIVTNLTKMILSWKKTDARRLCIIFTGEQSAAYARFAG
jgi:hypothetical protein